MHKPWWFATAGKVKVPAGLILAAKDGIDLGSDWSVWSAANGYFLRGTDSDAVVGTTGSRYALSENSLDGGQHSGSWGGNRIVAGYGEYSSNTPLRGNPSGDAAAEQGRHKHTVSVNGRPGYVRTRLIQAQNNAPVPIGAIMFGTAANAKQVLYSFTGGRYFYAGSSVSTGGDYYAFSGVQTVSDGHDHHNPVSTAPTGVTLGDGYPTGVSAAGGNHDHNDTGSLTMSFNLARCILRAFDIIDQKNIEGLIGMWAQAGIPDKWELVAATVNRFLMFSDTGAGTIAGNNTASFSGQLQSSSHYHSYTGSSVGNLVASRITHPGVINHTHGFSATKTYYPERYHIKFIRYIG